MNYRETERLRVLIANERKDRLALVAPIVVALGHEVIAREIDVEDVGPVTARERPDVALVGLGANSEHALALIDKIVREAACPVIVLLHTPDPGFVKEASKRGVFAHISDDDVEDWQSSIDIVLRRFAEYHDLQGAFGLRALTERAKGILMERHAIDEESAFAMRQQWLGRSSAGAQGARPVCGDRRPRPPRGGVGLAGLVDEDHYDASRRDLAEDTQCQPNPSPRGRRVAS
jgi:AmiR/NasT family two-component response regulator